MYRQQLLREWAFGAVVLLLSWYVAPRYALAVGVARGWV